MNLEILNANLSPILDYPNKIKKIFLLKNVQNENISIINVLLMAEKVAIYYTTSSENIGLVLPDTADIG